MQQLNVLKILLFLIFLKAFIVHLHGSFSFFIWFTSHIKSNLKSQAIKPNEMYNIISYANLPKLHTMQNTKTNWLSLKAWVHHLMFACKCILCSFLSHILCCMYSFVAHLLVGPPFLTTDLVVKAMESTTKLLLLNVSSAKFDLYSLHYESLFNITWIHKILVCS